MTHPTSPVFLLHSSLQEFKSKQGDKNASIREPNSGNPLPDSPYFFFEDPTFIASMAKALIPSIIKGVKHSSHPSDQPYRERMIYEHTTGNSLDKVLVSRGCNKLQLEHTFQRSTLRTIQTIWGKRQRNINLNPVAPPSRVKEQSLLVPGMPINLPSFTMVSKQFIGGRIVFFISFGRK